MDSSAQPDLISLVPDGDGDAASLSTSRNTAAQIETLRAELDGLRADIGRQAREIDDLQVRTAESHRPWFRNSQTLVAVVALLLSLVTAVTSGYWAKSQGDAAELRLDQQRIHDAKTELQGLLQAIAGLVRQSQAIDLSGDPMAAMINTTSLAGELEVLGDQAYGIVQSIPDQVSATEYFSLAEVLGAGGRIDQQEELLEMARPKAGTPFEEISVNRMLGVVLFNKNDYARGRELMQVAIAAGEAHFDDGLLALGWPQLENFRTHMLWAIWEAWGGHCGDAQDQLQAAETLYQQLNLIPGHPLIQQRNEATAAVGQCVEGARQTMLPPAVPALNDPPSGLADFSGVPTTEVQPAVENAASPAIDIYDFGLFPLEITVPANSNATLRLSNYGTVAGFFSIEELGVFVSIAVGETTETTINAAPGEYAFEFVALDLSDLSGSRSTAKVGTLIVE